MIYKNLHTYTPLYVVSGSVAIHVAVLACLHPNLSVKMSGPVTSLTIIFIYAVMYMHELYMVVFVVVYLAFTSLISNSTHSK